MADSNANIGVKVGGDVSPLQRELKKGSRSVAEFSKGARDATNTIAKFGVGAATAAAGGLTVLYNRQSKIIDSLAKTSDALDLNIANLQALHHIAELNGVSQESMNKNLQRMEMRLGEAARKGGAAADALEDVGLSVESLKGLGADKQMEIIAKSLGDIEDQTIKASIASDLFGRDGLKMLKVLKNLESEGLQPTIKELDALGVSMTRIDAAKVEAANDALFRVSQAASAAGQAFTTEMAPFVEAAANELISLAKEAGGFGEITKDAMQGASKAVGFFADMVHGLKVVFKGAELIASGFKGAAISAFELVSTAVSMFVDSAISDINFLITQLNKIPKVSIGLVDTVSDSDFMKGLHNLGDTARNEVSTIRSELHDLAMQEMPSEDVENFLNTVTQKSNDAAEAATSAAEAIRNQKHAAAEEVLDLDDLTNQKEYPSAKLDQIKATYKTEEEEFRRHNMVMSTIGDEFDRKRFETEGQWMEVRTQAIADHVSKIESIRRAERTSAVNIASSMGSSIMSLAQGHSKKAFELGKKASRASAVVNGIESAVAAWKAGMSTGGPFAIGKAAAYTAASLAKTGSLIRSINSQSFSGSGSQPSAPSGSIPSSAESGVGQGITSSGGQASQSSSIAIQLDPNAIVTGRGIIKLIEEAAENGANINFLGAS